MTGMQRMVEQFTNACCEFEAGIPSGPDALEVSRLVKHWKTLASHIYITIFLNILIDKGL